MLTVWQGERSSRWKYNTSFYHFFAAETTAVVDQPSYIKIEDDETENLTTSPKSNNGDEEDEITREKIVVVSQEPLDEKHFGLTKDLRDRTMSVISINPDRMDIKHSQFPEYQYERKMFMRGENYMPAVKGSFGRNVLLISESKDFDQPSIGSREQKMVILPKAHFDRKVSMISRKFDDEEHCKHHDEGPSSQRNGLSCGQKRVCCTDTEVNHSSQRKIVIVPDMNDENGCCNSQQEIHHDKRALLISSTRKSHEVSEDRKITAQKCFESNGGLLTKASDHKDMHNSIYIKNEGQKLCLREDRLPKGTVVVRKRRSSMPTDFNHAKRFNGSPKNTNVIVRNPQVVCDCSECLLSRPRVVRPLINVVSYCRPPGRCFCKQCQSESRMCNEPKYQTHRLPCCSSEQRKSCPQSNIETHNRSQANNSCGDSRCLKCCPGCKSNEGVSKDGILCNGTVDNNPKSKPHECNCPHCQENDRHLTHNGRYHGLVKKDEKELSRVPRFIKVPVLLESKDTEDYPIKNGPCLCDHCAHLRSKWIPVKKAVSGHITRRDTETCYKPTDAHLKPVTSNKRPEKFCDADYPNDLPSFACKEENSVMRRNKENKSRASLPVNKSRIVANWLERKRVAELNQAFEKLRKMVPPYGNEDRSLSKIKTLRYAVTYISHLGFILSKQKKYGYFDVKRETRRLYDIDPLFQKCREHMEMKDVI